jgi:hypothetical protein
MPSVPLHDLPIQAKFTSFRWRQLALEQACVLPDLIGSGRSQLKHWLKRWPFPPFWRQRHLQLSPTFRANDYALDMKGAPGAVG